MLFITWIKIQKNCKKGRVPRDHESAPGFACDASEFFFGIQRHPANTNTLCLKTRCTQVYHMVWKACDWARIVGPSWSRCREVMPL